jgi:hypothetical protein
MDSQHPQGQEGPARRTTLAALPADDCSPLATLCSSNRMNINVGGARIQSGCYRIGTLLAKARGASYGGR